MAFFLARFLFLSSIFLFPTDADEYPYLYNNRKLTWQDANAWCQKFGRELLTVSSELEKNKLVEENIISGESWVKLDFVVRKTLRDNSTKGCTYLGNNTGNWSLSLSPCTATKPSVCFWKESFREKNIQRELGSESPNILLIYADDLGYGDLKSYNPSSKIPTKNLDILASKGMRFVDAHSSSGICSPSRYALLTGRYHWRKFFKHVQSYGEPALDSNELTIPKMLKSKGYHTAHMGKWHLGWNWDAIMKKGKKSKLPEDFDWDARIPGGPVEYGGFDYYFGEDAINYPPYCWFENEGVYGDKPNAFFSSGEFSKLKQKEGSMHHNPGPMVEGWDFYKVLPTLVDKGVEYITTQEGPWFLYFSFPSPHLPIIANDEFDGTSDAGPYGDSVVELDDSVGKLVNAVGNTNTLIIFTSDNGPETLNNLAYSRALDLDHWSAAPLRGGKRDTFEGGHRVPFIVTWPGHIPQGLVSDAIVCQTDIFATLASIIGYKIPDKLAEDSLDQLDVFLGTNTYRIRENIVYNTLENEFAIREKEMIYIDSKSGYSKFPPNSAWNTKYGYISDSDRDGQLFNLTADEPQKHTLIRGTYNNLPESTKSMVSCLKDALNQIQTNSPAMFVPSCVTAAPTSVPTSTPTTSSPTLNPSANPTSFPTKTPTGSPMTSSPSNKPTTSPVTSSPSNKPTTSPVTSSPTNIPTKAPSTSSPTVNPSTSPTTATTRPTTSSPSNKPTTSPVTSSPTNIPTKAPSTNSPTVKPSASPTTSSPSNEPTLKPTTLSPSKNPTKGPTTNSPSNEPTLKPTTLSPSYGPTITYKPTISPYSNSPSISAGKSTLDTEDSFVTKAFFLSFLVIGICLLTAVISIQILSRTWKKYTRLEL